MKSNGGNSLTDQVKIAMNRKCVDRLINRVDKVEEALKLRILIENPRSYMDLAESNLVEIELLAEVARRSGCGLLVDVNNIYVSAHNLRTSAKAYIDAVPAELVGEIHLAGHDRSQTSDGPVLIDSHSRPVDSAVWTVYDRLITRIGARPTLIEWDNDLPDWPVLADEAARADALLNAVTGEVEPVT